MFLHTSFSVWAITCKKHPLNSSKSVRHACTVYSINIWDIECLRCWRRATWCPPRKRELVEFYVLWGGTVCRSLLNSCKFYLYYANRPRLKVTDTRSLDHALRLGLMLTGPSSWYYSNRPRLKLTAHEIMDFYCLKDEPLDQNIKMTPGQCSYLKKEKKQTERCDPVVQKLVGTGLVFLSSHLCSISRFTPSAVWLWPRSNSGLSSCVCVCVCDLSLPWVI